MVVLMILNGENLFIAFYLDVLKVLSQLGILHTGKKFSHWVCFLCFIFIYTLRIAQLFRSNLPWKFKSQQTLKYANIFIHDVGKMTTLRKLLLTGNPMRTLRRYELLCCIFFILNASANCIVNQFIYPSAHWLMDPHLLYWSIFEVDFRKVKVYWLLSRVADFHQNLFWLLYSIYFDQIINPSFSFRYWSEYNKRGCHRHGNSIVYHLKGITHNLRLARFFVFYLVLFWVKNESCLRLNCIFFFIL